MSWPWRQTNTLHPWVHGSRPCQEPLQIMRIQMSMPLQVSSFASTIPFLVTKLPNAPNLVALRRPQKDPAPQKQTGETSAPAEDFRIKQSLGRPTFLHRVPSSCPRRNLRTLFPCRHGSRSEHCATKSFRPKQTSKFVPRSSKWIQNKVIWHLSYDYQH